MQSLHDLHLSIVYVDNVLNSTLCKSFVEPGKPWNIGIAGNELWPKWVLWNFVQPQANNSDF